MRIIISILFLLLATSKGFSQELPKDFEEKIRKEYLSVSPDVRQTELNLTFEEYLDRRIQSYRKKQQFYTSIIGLRSVNNLCDNGTFENGDINVGDWNFYWEGGQGTLFGTNRLNTGSFNSGGSHNTQVHHSTVPIGADPYFGSLNRVWNFPSGNTSALRLGNANSGCGLESIAKVVTITSSNAIFTFSYAMVMDNPAGHGNALPFFEVNIIDAATPTNNYNNLINLGNNSNRISSNNPLLQPNNTNAQRRWKDWTCVTSDLSSLIGQTVIIEFVNRDCWACGHWSYTYLDNVCLSCEGANGDEGSININQGQSSDCEIPGQICIDYTLPNGNNPTLDLELQIIQNGTIITTLNSPTLSSGNSYCFNLTTSNTSGLNLSLSGFDYKIIGQPALGGFNLTPKIIGTSSYGVSNGINNDYDLYCPPDLNCCQTKLDIWNYYGTPNPLPVQSTTVNGIDLSYAEETFELHQDATIPITELKVNITDINFEYNYEQCAECINNPALWGSIYSPDNTIGTAPSVLSQNPPFNLSNLVNDITSGKNTREIVWDNPNGAMLKNGNTFKVGYILPPLSEIPCCATKVKICTKISWKDANCNVCEIYTCSDIDLQEQPITDKDLSIVIKKEGCCNRVLTANTNANATYKWNNGSTSKSITVSENGSYTVTVTAGGSSITKTILVTDIMSGAFPLLSFNSLFHPDYVPPYKNKFYIMDISPGKVTQGIPNSYNANEYKLEIWHRWNTQGGQGNPLKTITGTSAECNGFNNWDIYWDGTDQTGASLKDEKADSYVWRLTLKNCTNESSRLTYRTTWNPKCGDCVKWKKFLWWTWCAEYEGCWNTETFEFGDVQMTR